MSNVMAAIGIEQMGRFPEFSEKRKLLASIYFSELSSCSGLRMIDHDYTQVVPHIFVVILSSDIDRDAVRQKLLEDGVETGVHYKPNHLLSYYSDNHSVSLNNVESIYPCLLSLPLHPDLDEADVKYVCNKLINIVM